MPPIQMMLVDFEKQMRRKVHYVIKPEHLWSNITEMARTQNDDLLITLESGFRYIENESFDNSFQGLFSEINLNSEKLGKTSAERNAKALHYHPKNIRRHCRVFYRYRHAGRCIRISDWSVCRRFREKSRRILYPATDLNHSFQNCNTG
jgi:type I restriction-modification system DNA methylase subunit